MEARAGEPGALCGAHVLRIPRDTEYQEPSLDLALVEQWLIIWCMGSGPGVGGAVVDHLVHGQRPPWPHENCGGAAGRVTKSKLLP